jgi:hypothetical protein
MPFWPRKYPRLPGISAHLETAIKVAAAHPLASTGMVEVRPLEDFPGDK